MCCGWKISSLGYQQMEPLTWLGNIKVLLPTLVTIQTIWYIVFGVVLINWIWLFNLRQDNFCMVHFCRLLQIWLETCRVKRTSSWNWKPNVHGLLKQGGCLWLYCFNGLMPIKSNLSNFGWASAFVEATTALVVSAIVMEQIFMRANEGLPDCKDWLCFFHNIDNFWMN